MLGHFRGLLNSMNDGLWAADRSWSSDKLAESDFTQWSVARVARWVSDDVGLPQYSKPFVKAKVDGQALSKIDSTTLKKTIKVSSVGHRLKILEAVDRLQRPKKSLSTSGDLLNENDSSDEEDDGNSAAAPTVQYILMKKSREPGSPGSSSPVSARKRSNTFVFFESCLEVDSLRAIFKQHLQQQMCAENLELWEAIEKYKTEPSLYSAVHITNEFIVPDSPRQVNLSTEIVQGTIRALSILLSANKVTLKSSKDEIGFVPTAPTLFQEVQTTTHYLMMTHSFPIFLKSQEFKQWSNDNGVSVYMKQGEELIAITSSSDSSPRSPPGDSSSGSGSGSAK